MLTPEQIETYNFIRYEVARLRGPQSHVPLSLDEVSELVDAGDDALFRVNGSRVFVRKSGKIIDAGLPDCPTYACGLLPKRFLPAIAADLLSPGNPHKRFLANKLHTPATFEAYLQHGTVLDHGDRGGGLATSRAEKRVPRDSADPYRFVLDPELSQVLRDPAKRDALVARRLKMLGEATIKQDAVFKAGAGIASGNYSRENLKVIVAWKMEGSVHFKPVMSELDQNTKAEIANALRLAVTATTEKSAVGAFSEPPSKLHGVGVAVGSAILMAIDPKKYTIIDVYALRSLGVGDAPMGSVRYYLAYLQKCRELAQLHNITLRTLDHALWQWAYEHRLRRR